MIRPANIFAAYVIGSEPKPEYRGCYPTEQQEARERLRNLICGAVIFTAFGSILTTAVNVFLA